MIRLLALDIDDTLVNSSLQISKNNAAAIRAAVDNHVTVVLATGRGYLGSRIVRETLQLKTPVIVYGGAMIVDASANEVLHAEYLDDADVHACFDIADRYGIHGQIYEGDTVVFREENAFTRQYTERLRLPFRIDPNMLSRPCSQTPKVLLYTDPEKQSEHLSVLERELPAHLHALTSKPGFLEIGRKSCTKGTALAWLAGYLGIMKEDVAAIGDNTLDMDMIRWAGTGCCVENGNAAVKAVSDMILPSCDDDGVAYFIKTYIPGC